MLRLRLAAVTVLLLVPLLGGLAHGETSGGRYLVGYQPGSDQAARLAVAAAGGDVKRDSPELGFLVVETSRPQDFERLAAMSPAVQYVERDDPIRLDGAQWNGAQWNGAQWNGAQWNGAQWNGAQWNGAQWNGAQWNGAQWNGAQWNAAHWTKQAFDASGGTKLKYDTGTTDPGLVWQWGAWTVDLPEAWQTTAGTRTASLCVLDSGVAWDHPDLAANVAGTGYNARDPLASAYDDAGHGTHVAGVAAAATGNAFGVAGAGNVRILPVKVLSSEGTGYESDLAFGLAWCAQQRASVALMALSVTGVEPTRPTLDRALGYAAASDVLLVASAGNTGPCADCVAYPASDPRVVAVSAVDGNLTLAPFSSRGADVELAAPGVYVLGTFPGGSFVFGSGTSQAAALASGVAALVRDANPGLSAAAARAILRQSAADLGPAGVDPSFGHGLVDADGALALARAG